uniref:Uncharacterized protein n=1 Tax=Romanomermis culicivorax TaxID=13658 RepID=A0A915JHI0_ROMCU
MEVSGVFAGESFYASQSDRSQKLWPKQSNKPCFFQKYNSVQNNYGRRGQADHIPFVLYELCEICNKSTKPHPAACYPDHSSEPVVQFGYPCVSGTKLKTYCAGDFSCVATYKDSPDSYEKRPLMTCDK